MPFPSDAARSSFCQWVVAGLPSKRPASASTMAISLAPMLAASVRLIVYPDPDRLAVGAADLIASLVVEHSGTFTLGLAGGTTPGRMYELLRRRPLPWERVDAFPADERWVPFSDEQSNGGAAWRLLFAHVPARLHAVPWAADGSPRKAALRYEHELKRLLPLEDGLHRADLILLGLGRDGHTASLFPGTDALGERVRLYVANWVEGLEAWRLSATLHLLHAARRIVFLVAGGDKAPTVADVLAGGSDLPAALVMEGASDVTWLLDRPAAEGLDRGDLEWAP